MSCSSKIIIFPYGKQKCSGHDQVEINYEKCAQLGSTYKFQTLHIAFELSFNRMMVVMMVTVVMVATLPSCIHVVYFSLCGNCGLIYLYLIHSGQEVERSVLSRTIRVVHWVFQSLVKIWTFHGLTSGTSQDPRLPWSQVSGKYQNFRPFSHELGCDAGD